jgi:hypothetical protein
MFLETKLVFQPMCAGYNYSNSHFVSSMLYLSATLGCEGLETLNTAAVAIHRKIFEAHDPAALAWLEHAVYGTDKQLIIQHPQACSLGNAVMMGQQPGTTTRGSFHGRQNVRFNVCTSVTSLPADVCHNGLPVSRRRRPRETDVLRFGRRL